MDWLEPFELETKEDDVILEMKPFRMQVLEQGTYEKNYSVLTQFYVLLGSQNKDSVTSIPLKDKLISDITISEIALHFDERKVVVEDGVPVELQLSQPNQESLSEVKSGVVNPVVGSIFSKQEITEYEYEWSPTKSFRVIPEKVDSYIDEEFKKVLSYLKSTVNQEVSLNLTGRSLKDSLQELPAIRYLAHHCKNVCLWIDESKQVTSLQIEF